MPGTHDAGSVMHVHPNITISSQLRFASMQTDAYPHRDAFGPGMLCENPLNGCGSRNRISGTGKSDEEGIPLGVNFLAVVLHEHLPQQVSAIGQHISIGLT